jgi:hypothetical protein
MLGIMIILNGFSRSLRSLMIMIECESRTNAGDLLEEGVPLDYHCHYPRSCLSPSTSQIDSSLKYRQSFNLNSPSKSFHFQRNPD